MFNKVKKFLINPDFSPTSFLGWVRFFVVWVLLMLVSLLVIGLIAFSSELYGAYKKSELKEKEAEEKKQVGTQASVAGMLLASAQKDCNSIGIYSVDDCAAYKGVLLQEIAAPISARAAIVQRDKFWLTCNKYNTNDYCLSLINRAYAISYNSN